MTIGITCPKCGQALQFPDEQRGQQASCPNCNQPMVLPSELASELPPGGASGLPGATDAYGWRPPPQATRLSILAVPALVLSIIPFTVPIGVLLAIITLLRNRRRQEVSGNGWAAVGLGFAVAWAILGLVGFIFGLIGDVEYHGHRPQCASNLRGLANTLKLYAQSYDDQYPAIGRGKKTDGTPGDPDSIDTQGSLWLMVYTGKIPPEALICPQDKAARAFKGTVGWTTKTADGYSWEPGPSSLKCPFPEVGDNGFPKVGGGHRSWSYSYQIPNGEQGLGNPGTPNEKNNTKFAIMADRAPFRDDLLIPPNSVKNQVTGQAWLNGLPASDKVRVNSPNHQGDGQNVLYQDGHVKFQLNPWCGINDDNIYTRATGKVDKAQSEAGDYSARTIGTKCDANSGPYDDDDSVLCNILEGVWCK